MGSLARATIVYQYIADISSFTGAPGTAVPPINIFLQQTVSGEARFDMPGRAAFGG
jgi:hypothetical protein